MFRFGVAVQVFLSGDEHEQSGDHADAGRTEYPTPTPHFAEVAADQARKQRADIDAGIKDGETGIQTRIVLRIQLADDGRDVRFQESDAADDERERKIEN